MIQKSLNMTSLDWMHFIKQTQGGSLIKDCRSLRSVRVQFWLQLWSVSALKITKWRFFCWLVSRPVAEIMTKEVKLIFISRYCNKICKLNVWRNVCRSVMEWEGEGMRMNRPTTRTWRETKTQATARDEVQTQSEPEGLYFEIKWNISLYKQWHNRLYLTNNTKVFKIVVFSVLWVIFWIFFIKFFLHLCGPDQCDPYQINLKGSVCRIQGNLLAEM